MGQYMGYGRIRALAGTGHEYHIPYHHATQAKEGFG